MNSIEFRRHLHSRPELSFEEHETAHFIAQTLTSLGIENRSIANTGVLACIHGTRPCDDRRAVVLRADIDALPILEQCEVAWRSQRDGVMHACGHDMHASVLFGVLQQVATNPDFAGTLFGLFQPGEECNPGGASLVLAEDPFCNYEIYAVIGEHVEPQLEVGTLGFRAGKYMAAGDEVRLFVHGEGGHGAIRNQVKDPIAAAAELITSLLRLNSPERVLSIGRIEAAGATNIIPDVVSLEGTMRTFDEDLRIESYRLIERIAAEIDTRHHTSTKVQLNRGYPCVVNDPALTETAIALASACGLQIEHLGLRTTTEDFGFFSHRYPSIFYRLGVGKASGKTHTAYFSPDERAIEVGIQFMTRLAMTLLTR